MCFNREMTNLTRFEADRVWLAPMSGSTDAAFRRQVVKFGCPAVVSEMVASDALTANRPDVVRRTCRHEGEGDWIVQLAARRPEHMMGASQRLVELGVDVIDINMGCPSRQVTGGRSGSALMREPALALEIIDAALAGAGRQPVTLKMRLGWDHDLLNAPEIAQAAVARGVRMITVHGRTRCQFYKGEADWRRIKDTVDAVDVPVIANGDIGSLMDAETALEQSGAHGVMVGRSAMGRAWLPAQIKAHLEGRHFDTPSIAAQCESLVEQVTDSVDLYGERLGVRMVRKHISSAIDHLDMDLPDLEKRELRAQLCQIDAAETLIGALRRVYSNQVHEMAA